MDETEIKRELAKLSPAQLRELTKKGANLNLRVREYDKDDMTSQAKAEGVTLSDYLVSLHRDHMNRLNEED
jgi:uncharacterized protein (DUF1778 family)